MFSNEVFVLFLGALFGCLALWAFKRLPHEQWQILASVPIMKDSSGQWHGLNFTYYGLLTANALVFGVAMLIILLGALHVPTAVTLTIILAVLLVCLPAAKWMARLIEGKQCTFTVAGAFFVGLFVAPAVLQIVNWGLVAAGLPRVPTIPALAAIMVAYAFGEGLGRLACISFGCCYGKSLPEVHPMLRKIFENWYFVFSGKMKKISYAGGMDGKQVIPVQAVTAVLCIAVGLLSTFLFLRGEYDMAFGIAVAVTQGWRSLSEALRADYRGAGTFSPYQVMAIGAIFYSAGLIYALSGNPTLTPALYAGLEALWHPAVLLSLQVLWAIVFMFFGKSMVTGAEISFHLYHDRI
jgi:hypothetical protein